MIIRAKTFKAWMQANYTKTELQDVVRYGADVGHTGMVYYSETTKLYARFKQEIWAVLLEEASDLGTSPLQMIACFNRASEVETANHFENLLVWFMAEVTARDLLAERYAS